MAWHLCGTAMRANAVSSLCGIVPPQALLKSGVPAKQISWVCPEMVEELQEPPKLRELVDSQLKARLPPYVDRRRGSV